MTAVARMTTVAMVLGLGVATGGCDTDDLSKGQVPQLTVAVASSAQKDGSGRYLFAKVAIGSGEKSAVQVTLRNSGDAALLISKVELLDKNADGTPKNKWVKIDYGGEFDPNVGFPKRIDPKDTFITILKFDVVFKPDEIDNNFATIRISSNDTSKPTTDLQFGPAGCAPIIRIDPPSGVFQNASLVNPGRADFIVTNQGNCDLKITSVKLREATTKFTLDVPTIPEGGFVITPKGDTQVPMKFVVSYAPKEPNPKDTAEVEVLSNDPGQSPMYVSLTSQVEGGTFDFSYDGKDKGCMDFAAVTAGSKTLAVSINNKGPSSFTILKTTGLEVPEDPTGKFYTVDLCEVGTGGSCTVVDLKKTSYAIAANRSADIRVTYKASASGLNATLRVNYNYGEGLSKLDIPLCGGTPKSCFDLGPGSQAALLPFTFVGKKDEPVKRDIVISNCGNAPLTVKAIRIEDDFGLGKPSEYFGLETPLAGDVIVNEGALSRHTIVMTVKDAETKVGARVTVDYLDPAAKPIAATALELNGYIDPIWSTPIADAGGPYTAKKGTEVVLDGTKSTAGSLGIAQVGGYVWTLLEKPAGSKVKNLGSVQNGGGFAFTPDVAGKYLFDLRVAGGAEPFPWSAPALATVDVTD